MENQPRLKQFNLKFNLTCNTHTPLIWTLSMAPAVSIHVNRVWLQLTVIIVIIIILLVSLAKALVNTSSTTFYDCLNFSLCDGSARNLLFPPPPLLAQVTHCSVFRESSLSMMYDVACYSCFTAYVCQWIACLCYFSYVCVVIEWEP